MSAQFDGLISRGVIIALCLLATSGISQAEGYKVLYNFCSQQPYCSDGAEAAPGELISGAQGELIGGTWAGQKGANCAFASGCGILFKLATDGTYTVLYNACSQTGCADGAAPVGRLVADQNGNLYGAMELGGVSTYCPTNEVAGCGVVFKLAPDGTYTVLYTFCSQANCADGALPTGSLVFDSQGNLYGTTGLGGNGSCNPYSAPGCGTVFKLSPGGQETVLHAFCSESGCRDGALPEAGLISDSKNNVYGTTSAGGASASCRHGCGVVFKVNQREKEVVLYRFCSQPNCSDGANPYAGLLMDQAGNLLGTTTYGGNANGGTVFKLAPDRTESVLYSFCSRRKCHDGALPFSGLIQDGQGNLWGTTAYGGFGSAVGLCNGCGVIFKLTPTGTQSVLYSFCTANYCYDGGLPESALLETGKQVFVGVTTFGGSGQGPAGTIFKLAE